MTRLFSSAKPLTLLGASLLFAACGGQDSAVSQPSQGVAAAPAPAITQTAAQTLSPKEALMKRGEKLYKRCQTCHTLNEGGKHKVGPNMWDLYGSTAGQKDGFAYSKAMSESGLVWTDETLSAYIENPRKYMPGNRMSYVGLRKPEDREAVLAYIKAQTTPK